MALSPEHVAVIDQLDQRTQLACSDLENSAILAAYPDPVFGHLFGDTAFTLADILQVAILTRTHILLVGDTGTAKTDMLRMVSTAAFGDQWHLLRLNPHLDEQTFADIDYKKLNSDSDDSTVRDCVRPAEFLDNPLLVLDELNRTPAALTNILLGYLDGRIELKFGIKKDIGYKQAGGNGEPNRYDLVVGAMNSGVEFDGTFGTDRALGDRFILRIPMSCCRPTDENIVAVALRRRGRANIPSMSSMADDIAGVSRQLKEVPLDDLSLLYWIYLANLDHCPHSSDGHKTRPQRPEACMHSECRVFKQAEGFCAYASAMSLRVGIYLMNAATGLAALRAARTLRQVNAACEGNGAAPGETIKALQTFAKCRGRGQTLARRVTERYLSRLSVSVDEIISLLPMALSGKQCLSEEYTAKRHGGNEWQALQEYGRETYSCLEAFFRDNRPAFEDIPNGNGAVLKLRERLAHAEKFTDPFIGHVLGPFLDKIGEGRPTKDIEEEMAKRKEIGSIITLVTDAAAMRPGTVGAR